MFFLGGCWDLLLLVLDGGEVRREHPSEGCWQRRRAEIPKPRVDGAGPERQQGRTQPAPALHALVKGSSRKKASARHGL